MSYSGLKVPNDAITQKDGINYVVRNRAGYLSKIPIKIGTVNKKEAKNEKYTIIENYTTDELRKIGYTDKQINNITKILKFNYIY